MKIMVVGYKRHGKDAASEYLAEHAGISFSSSSWYACQKFLYEDLRQKYGYRTIEECFADRDNHRQEWFEAIVAYNTPDLARMAREIFAEHDNYCGLRNRDEFLAARAAGLFDIAIWIDASQRKPPETSNSMTLRREDADIVVDNNGSLLALHARLDELVSELGLGDRQRDRSLGLAQSRLRQGVAP